MNLWLSQKFLVRKVLVCQAILLVILSGKVLSQSIKFDSDYEYLWSINSDILNISRGSIITDAVLKFENLTNQSVFDQQISVFLVNNPPPGLSLKDKIHDATGLSQKKSFIGLVDIPANSTDNYSIRFSEINNPQSWCWNVFRYPFKYRLADSRTIEYSSAVLELIDYAGTDSGFGIAIGCSSHINLLCKSVSIELKIEPFLNEPYRLFQKISLSAVAPSNPDPNNLSVLSYIENQQAKHLYQFNSRNFGPILNIAGQKTIEQGNLLEIELLADDVDDEIISINTSSLPQGAIFQDNVFSWTPNLDQTGTYTIIFTANDGKNIDTARLNIDVIPSNTPPVITSQTEISHRIGQAFSFTITANDADNDRLRYAIENPLTGMMLMGNMIYWNPTDSDLGVHELIISVSDGKSKVSGKITINVLSSNNRPVIEDIPVQTGYTNQTIMFEILASDIDGDQMKYYAENMPSGSIMVSNMFIWTPSSNQEGAFTFTVKVSDGKEAASQNVTLKIQ